MLIGYARPMSDSANIPKYLWRYTWPDKANDWSGSDGPLTFGRILKHFQYDWWDWHLNGWGMGSANGQAPNARQAALALEKEYDRAKASLIEKGRFDEMMAGALRAYRTTPNR